MIEESALLILPLFCPEITVSIPLRPLNLGLNLLAAEESGLAGLVVRDAVEVEPIVNNLHMGSIPYIRH